MAERQKLEVTVLSGQNFSSGQKDQARKNIDAAAESALFGLSAKTISEIKTTETVTATPHTAADGTIYYELEAAPEVSDTIIKPENGLYASQQNTIWTIGISADYLSANALDSYSGNWQNAYKAVSAYSGDFGYWKTEYELVSSNSAKWNEVTAFSAISGKFALSADVNAEFAATSAWAKKTFQPSGDYLSASEKYLSANALDNLSGSWESVYNSVYDTSADWNNAYKWAKDNSANIIDASATLKANSASWNETSAALAENSGHWDSVYNSVLANSASWNETSATLNTNSGKWEQAFTAVSSNSGYWDNVYNSVLNNSASWNETSAVVNENSGFWGQAYTALTSTSAAWNNHSALSAEVEKKLDTDAFEAWSATTDAWDKVYYSGADGIKVDEHIISISADYLSANALDDYSGKWNSVYDSVFGNSASWNETSATLKENSGKWEESYTALTNTSAIWNNHSALSAEVEKKLDTSAFETWKTAEFEPVKTDVETLKANSAHYSVESTNEYITVNSADHKFALTFVSGDLATKTWVEEQLGEFGGYVPCEGTGTDKHPAIDDPDPKKMYLVPKDDTIEPDRYYNWIVTGNETTGWLCVGDTSMDLTPYLKISDISGVSGNWNTAYTYVTANSGNIAEASATAIDVSNTVNTYSSNWQESYEALTSTSADWNKTYTYVTANSANIESVSSTVNANSGKWNEVSAFSANSGKFVTSALADFEPGLAHVLTKDENDVVAWSGIDLSDLGKIYPITSLTPDIVSATISAVDGTSAYVLSAKEPDPVEYFNISANKMSAWSGTEDNTKYYFLSGANISGNNGISAEYVPESNQWNIGLDKTNLVTYARFHTSNNTYTTSAEITGFAQDDYIGTDVYLDNAEVYANSGLYHVDMQVGITIPGNDNNYHSTILKSTTAPSRQVMQEIDGSYAHTETISLSYDIRVATDATKLTYTIEDLPRNTTFFVKDLNVHRVICSLSEIGGSTYQAGDGLLLQNDTFSVDIGDGLEFSGNHIQVKLGEGLKFDENAGVKAITIDSQVEEVVESVQKMENDLDSKLTTNFPMPQIDNVYDFANDSISTISNGAGLICQAFTVPINNPIRLATQDNPAGTLFGVYAKQGFTPKIMLALYVYDWTHTDYVADTGPIQIAAGRNEFPIKHINPNITELKSDCVYYAAIYIPAEARAQNGLSLAGCPSYAAASFINAIPRFTVRTENITGINMNDPDAGLNILDPQNPDNYIWGPWTDSYNEQPTVPRFFMQIRNGTIN